MSCIITYNGQNFTQEDFLDYLKSQIPLSQSTTITPTEFINHSGGAKGGDTVWDQVGREFGVTRERIRQIEAKALKKLKEKSSDKKLDDYINR